MGDVDKSINRYLIKNVDAMGYNADKSEVIKASYEAQRDFTPNLRPYLISRSGCAGMQGYVMVSLCRDLQSIHGIVIKL